jgi:hypothetical protein
MKPNLVVIEGNKAARYVNGKLDVVVNIEFNKHARQIVKEIELFRVNGLEVVADSN